MSHDKAAPYCLEFWDRYAPTPYWHPVRLGEEGNQTLEGMLASVDNLSFFKFRVRDTKTGKFVILNA